MSKGGDYMLKFLFCMPAVAIINELYRRYIEALEEEKRKKKEEEKNIK